MKRRTAREKKMMPGEKDQDERRIEKISVGGVDSLQSISGRFASSEDELSTVTKLSR